MSGLPLDAPPKGGLDLRSAVSTLLEICEAGPPRLITANLKWHEIHDALGLSASVAPLEPQDWAVGRLHPVGTAARHQGTCRNVRVLPGDYAAPNVVLRTDGENGDMISWCDQLDPTSCPRALALIDALGGGLDTSTITRVPATWARCICAAHAQHFRTLASVPVVRLARLLAAVPLSMPTIKLMQRVLSPSADLSAVAEVMLGGLLSKTSQRSADRDAVGYEFYQGVREELLSSGARSDTVRVARFMGAYLGTNPIVRNFIEALSVPANTPAPEQTAEIRPVLAVQEAVLRSLSGRHGPRTAHLRSKLRTRPLDTSSTIAAVPESEPPIQAFVRQKRTPTESPEIRPLFAGDHMTTSDSSHTEENGRTLTCQIWDTAPSRNPNFADCYKLLKQLHIRLLYHEIVATVTPEALCVTSDVSNQQTVDGDLYHPVSRCDLAWRVPSGHSTKTAQLMVCGLPKRPAPNIGQCAPTGGHHLQRLRICPVGAPALSRRWHGLRSGTDLTASAHRRPRHVRVGRGATTCVRVIDRKRGGDSRQFQPAC